MTEKRNRLIVLDTETTGISIKDGHKIIEIGCVEIIDNIITDNKFHYYINPEREIDEEALKVHNISRDFLNDKPVFRDIVTSFINFLEKDMDECNVYLVAHNANFDIKFINYEIEKAGLNADFCNKFRIIDTVIASRKIYPSQPANLNALCNRLGIDKSERDKNGHGALLDAKLLADVLIILLKDRSIDDISSKKIDFVGFIKRDNLLHNRDIYRISEKEMDLHRDFVNKYNFLSSD